MSQQQAAPSADLSTGGWTPTPVFSNIQTPTPADVTSVVSAVNPLVDSFEVKLSAMAWPQAGPQTLTIRIRKNSTAALTATVVLLQLQFPGGPEFIVASRTLTLNQVFTPYSFTLTSAEAQLITNYNRLRVQVFALGGLGPQLKGWWKFDEGSGTIAYDSSPNRNDGTLTNKSGTQINLPTWVTGIASLSPNPHALSFSGSNDVTIGNLDLNVFSCSLWVKRADLVDTGLDQDLVLSFYFPAGWTFGIGSASGSGLNNLFLWLGNNTLVSSGQIADTNVHHLVVTFDGTTAGFWIDAVQIDAKSGAPLFSGGGPYAFGLDYRGILDDIRVYSTVLSASVIKEIYEGKQ